MARPRLELDEKRILELAKEFATYEEIAADLGCSVDTLERRYADLIRKGHNQCRLSLRRKQFRWAMQTEDASAATKMLVWLGKQYLGQSEQVNHTGEQTLKTLELVVTKKEGGGRDGV